MTEPQQYHNDDRNHSSITMITESQ